MPSLISDLLPLGSETRLIQSMVASFDLAGRFILVRFNYPAKKLYKRLLQLNATALIERGDADDQHPLGFVLFRSVSTCFNMCSVDGGLDPWLEALWSKILEAYPLPEGLSIVPEQTSMSAPTFRIKFLTGEKLANSGSLSYSKNSYSIARVASNTRITSDDHFQDVRHIVLKDQEDSR